MFDIVRRRSYDTRRVLIDSARVLDSPFDDSLVCLSGAELEMVRNLTQYLHRQDTFIETYYNSHYVTPDVDDWDAIAAIVAGLEEKLMGCAETEAMIEALVTLATPIDSTYKTSWSAGPSGTEVKYITAPVEGFFRRMYRIIVWNGTRTGGQVTIGWHQPAGNTSIKHFTPVAAGELMTLRTVWTVAFPNSIYVVFTGCQEGDSLGLIAIQEDIEVPT